MMIQYPALVNPNPTEVRTFASTYVHQEYQLFISLPASYVDSNTTFPVMYLLDGNATYAMLRPTIELQQIMQTIPEMILVGIGYPAVTYMDTLVLRGRDLTSNELTTEQKSGGYPFEETGGGSKFLDFLAHELIPFIDREYRTDQNDRALLGLSLGANFALYAMLEQPALFNRVVAISPGVDLLDRDKQSLREIPSSPVMLYLAIEAPSHNVDILEAIEHLRQFVNGVSEGNPSGLKVKFEVFEGEDHASVGPIGFTHGLRQVYQ